MYERNITLFNRYTSQTGDLWFPTVIKMVDLITDKASINARMGTDNQDSAKLHIRYIGTDGKVYVAGKEWLPAKEWAKKPNDEMVNYLTFKSGKDFDFFMAGEYPEDVVDDNDYSEGFYDYINSHYDEVYVISSASNPYSLIPHFEIMGR